jgi:hypothetical protein
VILPRPDEESAIYRAIVALVGDSRIAVIHKDTSRGYTGNRDTMDCSGLERFLSTEMPEMDRALVSGFCAANDRSRPIDPAVIQAAGLELADWNAPELTSMLRLSSVQLDSTRSQALVFVDVRDGDFSRGVFLLLTKKDGRWRVQYSTQVYIS